MWEVSAADPAVGMQDPEVRLRTIEAAGQAAVPYTSGLLIGIGETRQERVQSLLDLRALHQQYEHIQVSAIRAIRFTCRTHVNPDCWRGTSDQSVAS